MERVCACLERLTEAEVRVATALERLISMSSTLVADSSRAVAGRDGRESKREKAFRLLVELGPDNVSAIAKAVGVDRTTLYRWPGFKNARDRLRAAEQWVKRTPRAVDPDEL